MQRNATQDLASYCEPAFSPEELLKYRIVGYFQGVCILRNENFCKDCTCEVATLDTWVWFSINFAKKINSANCGNFEIREIYTPQK